MKRLPAALACLLGASSLYASLLHEAKTVYLLDAELVAFEVYQKYYHADGRTKIFLREQDLLLSLSKSVELGLHVPFINHIEPELSQTRVGDVKVHLNFATEWFRSAGIFNYYVEFNTGTGPEYTELTTHGMESYGFQEWRTGLLFFRKWDTFSIHANLLYVFRNEGERGLFDAFGDGSTLNIFNKEAWMRGLGFNFNHDRTFFWRNNFKNDNLEYLLAVNTDIPYPFVPFLEFTFSHDFENDPGTYRRQAPGSGIYRSQISAGTKMLFNDDHFALKLSFTVPVMELAGLYQWGAGLGARLEF